MMRRWVSVIVAALTLLGGVGLAAPVAQAAPDAQADVGAQTSAGLRAGAGLEAARTVGSGWVPAPSAPFDRAAGELCDFAVHGQPVVDQVRKRTLQTNPDGTPRSELYVGKLVVRVTNVATGAFYDADASGDAVIVSAADGSSTWYVHGPVLVGFRAGTGNLPRGLYVIDGLYRLAFAPDGFKTLTMLRGTEDNVCTHIA
jgi:hypothetical protein